MISSDKQYILELGNEKIDLFQFTSHTEGDVLIHFHKNNSIFTGDTYMYNAYPHAYAGGSEGQCRVINKVLSVSNKKTYIVTTHGRFITKKPEFLSFKKRTEMWYEITHKLNAQGNPLEAILKNQELVAISKMFRPLSKGYLQQQVAKTPASEAFNKK